MYRVIVIGTQLISGGKLTDTLKVTALWITWKEELEDTKGVSRIRKKRTKGQTTQTLTIKACNGVRTTSVLIGSWSEANDIFTRPARPLNNVKGRD